MSAGRSVWPPCTNRSSGGPSSFSSSVYGLSNLDRSQIIIRRSWPEEASKLLCILENLTLFTSLVWPLRAKSFVFTFLMSQTATVPSADPVHMRYWSNGEQSTPRISPTCPSTELVGLFGSLMSQILNFLSSPTDAKMNSSKLFQATSSTIELCASKLSTASWLSWFWLVELISQTHTLQSSEPDSKRPFFSGFHARPYPS